MSTFSIGTLLILSFVLVLVSAKPLDAQIVNGSFEMNGQPSLAGWRFSCDAQSSDDAPSGGGVWSLKLAPGNFQDCFPGVGYQSAAGVRDGEVWTLTSWVRRDGPKMSTARIYFRIVDRSGGVRMLSSDTTTSNQWTRLSVTDTLRFAPDDTVQVVLDAGLTSGPTILDAGFGFDRVEIVRTDPVGVDRRPDGESLFNWGAYPNPFRESTTIWFALARAGPVVVELVDVLGRRVNIRDLGVLPAGKHSTAWDSFAVPAGTYVVSVRTRGATYRRRIVKVS